MNIRKKAIYMVLVMFCLNLTVFAQNISLNLNNVTVKKAIETLKETNGYSFVFRLRGHRYPENHFNSSN